MRANPRRTQRGAAGICAAMSFASGLSCASYSDAIARGQRYYEDNQYERALALWRDLDRRQAELEPAERARYAYFRGMTDYRLGYHDDARHWLAIARATDGSHPGLGAVWLGRLDSALADLGRNPSRSGDGAADVVQTIEAPPGTVWPGDPTSSGGAPIDESADPAPAAPSLERPTSEGMAADAGASPWR